MQKKLIILLVISLVVLGFSLRVYDLTKESLWLDEHESIRWANLTISKIIQPSEGGIRDIPLYNITLHYWVSLFGDGEFSVRFLSVIFGILALIMLYKIASLLFDRTTGIISLTIMALSTYHIYYSQEARRYSLMLFLAIASFYFLIKVLRERKKTATIYYVISTVLLLYTHIFGVFIVIAQNTYVLLSSVYAKKSARFNLKKWLGLQLVGVVLTLPLIIMVAKVTFAYAGTPVIQETSWIVPASLNAIIGSFRTFSGSQALLIIFCVIILISSLKMFIKRENKNTLLLSVWLLVPILLLAALSQISSLTQLARYSTRYLIAASPAFYLLVAWCIRKLWSNYIKVPLMAGIILLSLVQVQSYYKEQTKRPWRDVVEYIEANAESGDLVLFHQGFCQTSFDYYSIRTDLVKEPGTNRAILDTAELKSYMEGHNRVWLVLWNRTDNEEIKEALDDSSIASLSSRTYFEMEVCLFRKDEPTGEPS